MSETTSSVYSIEDEHRARAEFAAWSRFVDAADRSEFCAGWLSLLAARIDGARAALLLASDADGQPYTVVAAWPDPTRDLQYLGPVAQRALVDRAGVVSAPDGGVAQAVGPAHVGYPFEVAGRLAGVVVIDVGVSRSGNLQEALRQVHWASGWLRDHFLQPHIAQLRAELERVSALDELMATALQHQDPRSSTLAVANEIALRFGCDRVSVGFEVRGQVEIVAMSHAASFDVRSDMVRTLASAMDEVLDLGVALSSPRADADDLGAIAHDEAVRSLELAALLTVPVRDEGQTFGCITLERATGQPFTADEQRVAGVMGEALGPIWALQRERTQSWWQRTSEATRAAARALFGPRYPGMKLLGSMALILLVVLSVVEIDHRVSARTVIEGSTQRAVVAPYAGFIADGLVRAGDSVRVGQVIARMDDRDLRLERARWTAERDQLQRKYQVAMAAADLSSMGVMGAQIAQADAQLALAQEKLTRATLVAPFDGLVIAGDLSQSIGMPVEQGAVLFEVAPLKGYRVVLQVDDREISRVAVGQRGELVLSSLPEGAIPFTISAITPVSSQVDGRNVFRVEALVDRPSGRLRPGMEGVGKVVVGSRSILWVWTHPFVDWLRLSFWSWLP